MGRVVHFEIHAGDPTFAADFYASVFGWKVERWGDQPYWLIDTGSSTPGINGALVPRRGDPPAIGAPVNGYVCTIEVDHLEEIISTVVAKGGRLAVEPAAVPGVGWVAYVSDPEGNLFALMKSDEAAA